jgi:hypothetical protein
MNRVMEMTPGVSQDIHIMQRDQSPMLRGSSRQGTKSVTRIDKRACEIDRDHSG